MYSSTPSIFVAVSALASLASAVASDPIIVDMQKHPVAEDNIMSGDLQKQIIGGNQVKRDRMSYPYYGKQTEVLFGIRFDDQQSANSFNILNLFSRTANLGTCGGTLIAPDIVLTAAHCGDQTGKQVGINVVNKQDVDETKVAIRYCDDWIDHDEWNMATFNADFALCKLNEPVDMSKLSPYDITLEWNDDDDFDLDNQELIILGHGKVNGQDIHGSNSLMEARIKAYSLDDCRGTDMYGGQIKDSMICAGVDNGSRDGCQGDSGGPLVKRVTKGNKITDYLVGVASWGGNCGQATKPGVYARTSWASGWIIETACGEFGSVASWCEDEIEAETRAVEDEVCDVTAQIIVKTDNHGGETSWVLKERKHGRKLVAKRDYWINNQQNVHEVCLKKEMCYKFDIYDAYGDAMCSSKEGCQPLSIGLVGEDSYYYVDYNWESHLRLKFCTNDLGKVVRRWPKKKRKRRKKKKLTTTTASGESNQKN